MLQKSDLEILSLFDSDFNNFLKITPFLKKVKIYAKTYPQLHENIKTVSTNTIIASILNINPQIIALI